MLGGHQAEGMEGLLATAGSRQCRRLTPPEPVRQIGRACRPVMEHRSTRWPATGQLHKEMGALQGRLVALVLGMRRRPGEEPKDFVRRRGRAKAAEGEAA